MPRPEALVLDAVGGDELLGDGEVPLAEPLVDQAAKDALGIGHRRSFHPSRDASTAPNAGATIAGIAAEAGVSAETIYAAFRNKRTLLTEVMRGAVRGDDRVPTLAQPGARAVVAEPDPREKLRIFAATCADASRERRP